MAHIEAMEVTVCAKENTMDVDQTVESVAPSIPYVGPHRQAHDRTIIDRHHPYDRITSTSTNAVLDMFPAISENETYTCKFIYLPIK